MNFENNIHWYKYKYLETKIYKYIFSSTANLKCTPSDRQMYPYVYMHPKLGTPELQEKSCIAVLDRDKRSVGVKVHIIRFGWNLYELFRSNNFLETFKVRNYFSFGQVCFWSADLGRVFVAKKSVNTTAGTWLQTFFKKKQLGATTVRVHHLRKATNYILYFPSIIERNEMHLYIRNQLWLRNNMSCQTSSNETCE